MTAAQLRKRSETRMDTKRSRPSPHIGGVDLPGLEDRVDVDCRARSGPERDSKSTRYRMRDLGRGERAAKLAEPPGKVQLRHVSGRRAGPIGVRKRGLFAGAFRYLLHSTGANALESPHA